MSQPYGQQPGNPNQPHGGGYPNAGGMPAAPQEYQGAVTRPGSTTAAAVLAFVQGGLTLIASAILMIGLGAISSIEDDPSIGGVDIDDGMLAMIWVAAIVGLIGAGLLIWAGVKALSGTAGTLFIVAMALQIALCIFWLTQGGFLPILFAIMPIIALALFLGGPAKQYEASRRGR